jgi:anti-sigma B factor antagonist
MTIDFQEATIPGKLLITVKGEVDLFSASDFARQSIERIASKPMEVIIDFENVLYLDSSGTGALIRIIKICKMHKVPVCALGLKPGPRRVLAMVNLFDILPTHESLAEYRTKDEAGDKKCLCAEN